MLGTQTRTPADWKWFPPAIAALAGLLLTAVTANAEIVVVDTCGNTSSTAPANLDLSCNRDNRGAELENLSFQSWGEPTVTATGGAQIFDKHYDNVHLALTNLVTCGADSAYSRARVRYTFETDGGDRYEYGITTLLPLPTGCRHPIPVLRKSPKETFLVGLGHEIATIGPFEEAGSESARDLTRLFGAPDSSRRGKRASYTCTKRWSQLGMTVRTGLFGSMSGSPCSDGVFLSARLTGRGWHTPNGVSVGASAATARKASLGKCPAYLCQKGSRGYLLELHRTPCAATKVPGVVAETRRGRVRALLVLWRSCE